MNQNGHASVFDSSLVLPQRLEDDVTVESIIRAEGAAALPVCDSRQGAASPSEPATDTPLWHWAIAPAAAFRMTCDLFAAGDVKIEHSWTGSYDPVNKILLDATLMGRGTRSRAVFIPGDLKPGCMFVHSHPSGNVEPSDGDLEAAEKLAPLGVGMAIVDNSLKRWLLMTEPRPLSSPSSNRPRWWHLGRLSLVLHPKP